MPAFRSATNRFTTFRFDTLRGMFAPRKPRRPLLRVALGLVGVALLLALVFVSVFVGIAMLAVGVAAKLLRQRGKPVARDRRVVDGEYRVVGKHALPSA
jgi:hypothetical protein